VIARNAGRLERRQGILHERWSAPIDAIDRKGPVLRSVLEVNPAIADALQLMRDVIKHRQDAKRLADEPKHVAGSRRRPLSHIYG
jgi:hypothetical protein